MTIVLSDEYPNAHDNQQSFRKRPEKSQFSQTFSKFTAVIEEVCWLQNLIHKVGFLSLHTNGGVEWRGTGRAQGKFIRRAQGELNSAQGKFIRRTGAQSSLSPSTRPHCSCCDYQHDPSLMKQIFYHTPRIAFSVGTSRFYPIY